MAIKEVVVELGEKPEENRPVEIKKVKKLGTDYVQQGVDMDKVNRYGSVYILTTNAEFDSDLRCTSSGMIEIIYGKSVEFLMVSKETGFNYIESGVPTEAFKGDKILKLQSYKNYPNTNRYQVDRDSFVVHKKEKI
jgi:hypothetical protein